MAGDRDRAGISRRALAAGLLGGTALVAAAPARAALQCADYPGGRVCEAGIPSQLIHQVATTNPQFQSQWCWAACISMVFGYYGHAVNQARIVADAYGELVNLPADPMTLISSLNRTWIDDSGRPFQSVAQAGVSDVAEVARDLASNLPLIIGTMGHAVVLTAMTYSAPWVQGMYGPQPGQSTINSAEVRDPWPGRGHRVLTPQEWASIVFVARIRVG